MAYLPSKPQQATAGSCCLVRSCCSLCVDVIDGVWSRAGVALSDCKAMRLEPRDRAGDKTDFKLVVEARETANFWLTYVCTAVQLFVDLALAVLCTLNSTRGHAPWATLASWLLVVGWLLLLVQLYRLHLQACKRVSSLGGGHRGPCSQDFVYTGEVYVGLLSSLALTGSAIWTVAQALKQAQDHKLDKDTYASFDIWVPVALGFQAAVVPAFTKMLDKLATIPIGAEPADY